MGCCGVDLDIPNSTFSGDLLPISDGVFNIGSASREWASLYWGDGTRKGRLFANAGTNSLAIGSISAHNVEFRYNNVAQMVLTNAILEPNSSASCSLGDTAGNQWAQCSVGNGTIKGNFSFSNGNSSVVDGAFSNHSFEIRTNNTRRWSYDTSGNFIQDGSTGGDLVFNLTSAYIRSATADGTDDHRLTVTPTGFAQVTSPLNPDYLATRGAFVTMGGNELASNAGDLCLESGNGAASSVIAYLNSATNGQFKISKHTASRSTDTDLWLCTNSGNWVPGTDNLYNLGGTVNRPSNSYFYNQFFKGDHIGENTDNDFRTDTSDASDTKSLRFTGGGALNFAGTRGATFGLYGNEHASNPGKILLTAGAVATGEIVLETTNSSAFVRQRVNSTDVLTAKLGVLMYTPNSGEFDVLSSTNTNVLYIGGGTTTAAGNGPTIQFRGASAPAPAGALILDGGNTAAGDIYYRVNNASASHTFRGTGGLLLSINNSGDIIYNIAAPTIQFPTALSILANTADGSDSATLNLAGGGATFDDTRGSFVILKGNEAGTNPGDLILGAGNVTGGDIRFYAAGAERWQITKASSGSLIPVTASGVSIGTSSLMPAEVYFGSTTNTGFLSSSGGNASAIVGSFSNAALEFRTNNTRRWNIDTSGILQNNVSGNESTGAGTALLGSNSPAVTNTAPYTWIKLKTSDGSTVFMPVWK